MVQRIDSIDHSIIRLLSINARMSTPEIADRIADASDRVVRYRINQLLDKRIIQLSTIVIPGTIGFPVTAEVLLKVEVGRSLPMAQRLAEMERVSYASCTLGNHDVGLAVHARNTVDLYTNVIEIITSLPEVRDMSLSIVPILLKDIYHWQIPDSVIPSSAPPRKPPFFPEKFVPQKIDRVDREIVHLLMEDARMSAASISRHINNVSPRAVSDRIDSLIENDVIRATAVINPKKVGFPVRADLHIKVKSEHILDIANKLAGLEETSWVACAIGDSDLGIQVCVQDVEELYQFVFEVTHHIPGVTRTVTSLVSRVVKDSYDWRIPEQVVTDS